MINYIKIANPANASLHYNHASKSATPSFKGELTQSQINNKTSFRLLGRAAIFLFGSLIWNQLAKANILPDSIFPGCDANMLYKGGVMAMIVGFALQVTNVCRRA